MKTSALWIVPISIAILIISDSTGGALNVTLPFVTMMRLDASCSERLSISCGVLNVWHSSLIRELCRFLINFRRQFCNR
jgi:hypothetical protein